MFKLDDHANWGTCMWSLRHLLCPRAIGTLASHRSWIGMSFAIQMAINHISFHRQARMAQFHGWWPTPTKLRHCDPSYSLGWCEEWICPRWVAYHNVWVAPTVLQCCGENTSTHTLKRNWSWTQMRLWKSRVSCITMLLSHTFDPLLTLDLDKPVGGYFNLVEANGAVIT